MNFASKPWVKSFITYVAHSREKSIYLVISVCLLGCSEEVGLLHINSPASVAASLQLRV